MPKQNYCVYKHTSPNGKVYIGITGQKPESRWRNGTGYRGCNRFYNAICKYGWENIKHEILYTKLSKPQAEQKEMEIITLFDSTNEEKGYNIENGGNAVGSHSEQTKLKISKSNSGKKRSPEFIEAARKRMTGNRNCVGKTHSIDTIKKMKGKRPSMLGEKNKKAKTVEQYDNAKRLVATFESANIAEQLYSKGKRPCNVSACCRGKLKTAYGYIWRYAEGVTV
jgi:group I intron endonuclease